MKDGGNPGEQDRDTASLMPVLVFILNPQLLEKALERFYRSGENIFCSFALRLAP